mmetsp:Transcript_172777/g.553854  ORF Transcript_172777/g.553854 Transcript_172777/m.553854 type:complete len:205 (-) Transcript_172777:1068-1682(-)
MAALPLRVPILRQHPRLRAMRQRRATHEVLDDLPELLGVQPLLGSAAHLRIRLVEVREELVVVQLAISGCVCLVEELIDVEVGERVTQNALELLAIDLAIPIAIEAREGVSQDVAVDLDMTEEGCGKELGVFDLVVVIRVQPLEKVLSLCLRDVEALGQDVLEVLDRNGPRVFLINGQELSAKLIAVLRGHGPGHHGEHVAPEL